ncbi:MAG: CvpA family protein [Verrucomicrobia bacterium]|nr:CvpA family protein [Verrucomicrobiota bacterium]
MTIWILALLLLGCLAGIGYQQGAIRVAVSFIGIIVAALLAGPLARFVKPAVTIVGVANPVLIWLLPPFVVFVIVLSLFKVIGFSAHRKVDVHYKYKAGDLRLALWERLNARLGLCLGLLNGLAYLVLLSMVIYMFSYWTVQLASPDGDAKIIKIFNQMGRDLQRTGMARVARAIDPMPEVFYDAANLAGLLYQNSLLEARLSRYPAFLSLAEKPEFQAIAQDQTFGEARQRKAPIKELRTYPTVQAIVNRPDMLNLIWSIVSPDLKDLREFLEKGQSAKYSEKILGRWYFDVNGAMAAYRRAKPNTPSSEMLKIRKWMAVEYAKTMLVAAPDNQVMVRNYPQLKQLPGQPPTTELQTLQGRWKGANGDYELSLGSAGERKGKVESGRLVVTGVGFALVFTPED